MNFIELFSLFMFPALALLLIMMLIEKLDIEFLYQEIQEIFIEVEND